MKVEFLVWHENGDLVGEATWEDGHFIVETADLSSGYAEWDYSTVSQYYGAEWAKGYVEWLNEQCGCNWPQEEMCGVLTDHGYSIAISEEGGPNVAQIDPYYWV